jgi:hypothetical protein
MKKVFSILAIYTLIIFICCIAETFIYRTVPPLIETSVTNYRVMRGLGWFLMLLPTIFLSGFTVACAVLWKANTNNSKERFSAAMIDRYRTVMFSSLVFVALISFNEEIFRPLVKGTIASLESAPLELKSDLENTDRFLEAESYEIAYMYAKRAVTIAPKDGQAQAAFKKASDALEHWNNMNLASGDFVTAVEETRPLYVQDHNYTVAQLMEMSRQAAAEKRWFNSHYWASLAIDACKGVNTNQEDANILASNAWNELKNPEGFADDDQYRIHQLKWKGYTAYAKSDPDYLTAYYILYSLHKELAAKHKTDPDVEYYLERAKEGMENQYFFIDETNNFKELATGSDVCFSLVNPDGSKDVFYAKSVMNSPTVGNTVRYLKDMTIVQYSSSGRFLCSVYVPMAKAVSLGTSNIDDEEKQNIGIEKGWKEIPFLMMMAVDRDTEGKVSVPVYKRGETSLPQEIMDETGITTTGGSSPKGSSPYMLREHTYTMRLPMEYSDFASIDRASAGAETMTLFSLMRFIRNAREYGYAKESFFQTLLTRCLYPLFVLILFIVAAAAGWNYRIENAKSLFRTSWLFAIIIFGFIMFFASEMAFYLYKVLNYVIVGVCKAGAFPVAVVTYVALFVVASLYFMSRKK